MIRKNFSLTTIACSVLLGCAAPAVDGVSKSQFSSSNAAAGLSGGFRPNETLKVYSSSNSGQRSGVIDQTGDSYNYGPTARDIEIIPAKTSSSKDVNALLAPKRAKVLAGCNRDKVSDKIVCRMNVLPDSSDLNGGLYQIVSESGSLISSCVIGHNFPGKAASIRVDGNAAFVTNDRGCIVGDDASRLERQLRDGQKLLTRRVEWPYESPRDKEMIISGSFSAALELYRWSATADLKQLFSAK